MENPEQTAPKLKPSTAIAMIQVTRANSRDSIQYPSIVLPIASGPNKNPLCRRLGQYARRPTVTTTSPPGMQPRADVKPTKRAKGEPRILTHISIPSPGNKPRKVNPFTATGPPTDACKHHKTLCSRELPQSSKHYEVVLGYTRTQQTECLHLQMLKQKTHCLRSSVVRFFLSPTRLNVTSMFAASD